MGPFPGAFANDPGLRENTNTAFGTDAQRGYKQLAFFGSVDFDLIPRVLTVTAGTRHYTYDEFEDGSNFPTETANPLILNHPNGACTMAAPGMTSRLCGVRSSLQSFQARNRLCEPRQPGMAHHPGRHGVLHVFAGISSGWLQSYGYVTGSIALPRVAPYCGPTSTDPRCGKGGDLFKTDTSQYLTPVSWNSDNLINNELGVKSEFLNHRVVLNASAFRMSWNDVQWALGDLVNFGGLGFVANGPSYTVKGVELQLAARVTEGLTLQGSSSWNRSEQTNTPCLKSAGITPGTPSNPTPAGQCITVIRGVPYTNPWGPLGSSLPYSPPLQFNVRARYEWSAGAFRPFAMVSASHIASMRNTPEYYPDGNDPAQNPPTSTVLKYTIPGYTSYDAALGVSQGQLDGADSGNQYHKCVRADQHLVRSVHQGGNSAASARSHGAVCVYVLKGVEEMRNLPPPYGMSLLSSANVSAPASDSRPAVSPPLPPRAPHQHPASRSGSGWGTRPDKCAHANASDVGRPQAATEA